jgi:hypothetical protein
MTARGLTSGLGPELERLAFRIGIKPALRLVVPRGSSSALLPRGDTVAVVVAEYDAERDVLYVARTRGHAEALCAAERRALPRLASHTPDADVLAAHRELGRLLGYPRCCVEAFVARVARGVTVRHDGSHAAERFVAAEDALRASDASWARLNPLVARPLVPFAPCRFDCALAARYADALYDALALRRPRDAEALRALLVEPVRLRLDGTRVELRSPERAPLELRFDSF